MASPTFWLNRPLKRVAVVDDEVIERRAILVPENILALDAEIGLCAGGLLKNLDAIQSHLLILLKEIGHIAAVRKIELLRVHAIRPVAKEVDRRITVGQNIDAFWIDQEVTGGAIETLNKFIAAVIELCLLR